MDSEVDHSRLQPQWLYVFAGAVVIVAVGTIVLLAIVAAGFLHAGGEAMAGM